jgi:cytochrome P450 family 6
LTYLDMVISGWYLLKVISILYNVFLYFKLWFSETLRLHPPLQTFTRICSYPTTLNANGKPIRVDIGTPIAIPVYSIHTDEKHYPKPLEFNPENFNKENVERRHKFTFLGWGEGPRICIGTEITYSC